ncbi:hypothetical protein GCM10027343_02430 [Noviherbaspirillum agri]
MFLITLAAAAATVAAAAPVPLRWLDSTDIATGRGEKGPWQQNDSRYDYVDDGTVALDADGNIDVAWVEQGKKDVFFQRLSTDRAMPLAPPVNVSQSPATFSWLPRIAHAPGAPDAPGTIYLLWQEIIFSGGSHGGDMFFARSTDNGARFSEPVNISNSIGGDGKGRISRDVWHNGSYDLLAGPDGALYAVWTEYDGPLWFSRSVDGGKSFSRPKQIGGGTNAKPVRAPSLALGKDGTLYLAWRTGEDAGADIHVARSADGGERFSKPIVVAPGDTYSDAPKLAVGQDGVLHLVYAQSSSGPFGKYRILYTRSTDGAKSFDAPREVSKPLPSSIDSASFPSLALDGVGRLYVSYELFPDPSKRPRGLGMVVSADGGRSFSAPGVVPESSDPAGGSNGSHQGLLMSKIAASRNGTVAIINSSLQQGRQSRVWLMRGKWTGDR